ncbi:hypothetical protein PBY51_006934 [Eleginops maclovinus]|uniref:Uncharacterized protein n=1 Tax=Eleginops maclovinus TaxID=56733 RepID=A0AAN7X236_ELEMC|nr:hypothetical protein PBY51_006934 [Eleginops maclovinus]
MAADMILVMRGLAKLSQAVVETQSSTLRSGAGVAAAVQNVQSAAEQSLSGCYDENSGDVWPAADFFHRGRI